MLGIPLRLRLSEPSFFNENVFEPISLKLLVSFRVIPSVAVIIEISALIPIAIITKVSMVRNLLPKIARSANRIFSFKFTSHKHKEWFGEMWGHNTVVGWGLGVITFFGRVPLRSGTGCCVAIFVPLLSGTKDFHCTTSREIGVHMNIVAGVQLAFVPVVRVATDHKNNINSFVSWWHEPREILQWNEMPREGL